MKPIGACLPVLSPNICRHCLRGFPLCLAVAADPRVSPISLKNYSALLLHRPCLVSRSTMSSESSCNENTKRQLRSRATETAINETRPIRLISVVGLRLTLEETSRAHEIPESCFVFVGLRKKRLGDNESVERDSARPNRQARKLGKQVRWLSRVPRDPRALPPRLPTEPRP